MPPQVPEPPFLLRRLGLHQGVRHFFRLPERAWVFRRRGPPTCLEMVATRLPACKPCSIKSSLTRATTVARESICAPIITTPLGYRCWYQSVILRSRVSSATSILVTKSGTPWTSVTSVIAASNWLRAICRLVSVSAFCAATSAASRLVTLSGRFFGEICNCAQTS